MELNAKCAMIHARMKNPCDGAVEVYLKSEADRYIKKLTDGAISMFRLRELCRGLDRESPIGQIADAAFKHWNRVERLEDKVGRITLENAELRGYIASLKSRLNREEREHTLKIRHHKYKRCMDMAKICERLCIEFKELYYSATCGSLRRAYNQEIEHYRKWKLRWLGYTDKFNDKGGL